MNKKTCAWLGLSLLLAFLQSTMAAETNDVRAELKALIAKTQASIQEGKNTEAELSGELKEFDALLARHQKEKTDDAAQILFSKALLYLQVFQQPEKAAELLNQLKRVFPETRQVKDADEILSRLFLIGSKFPDFAEKDLQGKPLAIANYKGKVVLVDFWATWCGPCVAELPNVLGVYKKHHDQGFEIIGISLDKDEARLKNFIQEKNLPWPQYFDGNGWSNKLAVRYSIESIPSTFLLDGEGKIIGKDLRGDSLEEAVAKAIRGK